MLVISFARFGPRIRDLYDGFLRQVARFSAPRRRPRGRSLPIYGLSQHLRRDIGFDP